MTHVVSRARDLQQPSGLLEEQGNRQQPWPCHTAHQQAHAPNGAPVVVVVAEEGWDMLYARASDEACETHSPPRGGLCPARALHVLLVIILAHGVG